LVCEPERGESLNHDEGLCIGITYPLRIRVTLEFVIIFVLAFFLFLWFMHVLELDYFDEPQWTK
jgi:hypothetical protein